MNHTKRNQINWKFITPGPNLVSNKHIFFMLCQSSPHMVWTAAWGVFLKSLCFSGPSIIMKRSNEGFRSPIATFQGCNQLFLKSLKLNLIKTYSLVAWTRILPKLLRFSKMLIFFCTFFQVTMKTSPYLVILFLKILAFTSLIGCVEGQFRSSNSLGVRKNNYR